MKTPLTGLNLSGKLPMKFMDYIRKEGYRRFHGAVDASVYEYFQCKDSTKAVWYYKKGSYQCCGCREQCETDSQEGFQLFLGMDLPCDTPHDS